MSKTLVLQSHREPLPARWLQTCLDSVESWATTNKFDYKFIGDDLFSYVSQAVIDKTKSQSVIATDLARLKAMQAYLVKQYDTVVWCDADFLIFSPEKFNLPDNTYALGREVWVQAGEEKSKKLSVHVKVHNAFMMYRQGNSFLDFYTDTAEHLLMSNQGPMPPQFIGPKLLTAIHNVAQCPVLETAGMLSPLVIDDIAIGANGKGLALKLFQQKSNQSIAAANLCSSLNQRGEVNNQQLEACISVLLERKDGLV